MAELYDSYYEKLQKKIEKEQSSDLLKKKYDEPIFNEIIGVLERVDEKWLQTTEIFDEIKDTLNLNEVEQPKILRILKDMYKAKLIKNKFDRKKHYWKIK